ncbi:MAG: glycosyltransferase family 2 protein [Eubacteriales bacterium]|nr:glycosyltransferase family 2 protein [Eubacteriales bacterium]
MAEFNKKINDCRSQLAIVLPSLDPDAKFKGVVDGLINSGFENIVIVDDGSDADHQKWFSEAEKYPQCVVIHHKVNKGKGRALKTAFSYIIENFPDLSGVVTIDGDGQHLIGDIIACGNKMLENPDKVILGCRDFDLPNVPPRSVAGNKFTSRMFKILFGIELSDTQTGLRAIPADYFTRFCAISGERFEYETNMLLQMKRDGIDFIEQPIETVYDEEDYSSHYNAVKDSWKVGKVMLRFLCSGCGFRYAVSSVCSFIIDNGIYYFLLRFLGMAHKGLYQIISRIVSSFFNFNMNKFFAFRTKDNYGKECLRYYCLCIPQAIVSYILVNSVDSLLNISSPGLATVVKIIIETIIFFISYYIQKKWVFKRKNDNTNT